MDTGRDRAKLPLWTDGGMAMASWDREKPLSPALLRVSVGLVGALCVVWTIASTAFSVLAMFEGRYGPAVVQMVSGLAAPFAVWLGLRLLADMVILQHRMAERGGRGGVPAMAVSRAADDGPNYEAAE
jgi:hypothetical protein